MALDQSIVNLAKAIRQHETGNRNLSGGSGESGRYQFMPGTWARWAKQFLGDANAPKTLENENKVAYKQIEKWKNQGYNPAQIASMWNAGEGRPNAYKENWRGVNTTTGVSFDTPQYVKNVYAIYQKLKAETPQPVEVAAKEEMQPLPELKTGIFNPQGKTYGEFYSGIGTAAKEKAGGALEWINKKYEQFTQLPGVKQFGQVIGGVVGSAGGLIGGAVGAVGETARQSYLGLTGKGFDAKQILESTKQTAKETAGFGYDVGSAGAPAALTGGAGKVIQVLLASGMGYDGYKTLKEGIAEGDSVKMEQGALALGAALFAGKNVVKNKGLLLDKEFKTQLKSEIEYISKSAGKIKGALEPKYSTGLIPKQELVSKDIKKATEVYREVLRPTAGELKKIEVYRNEDINDIYKFLVEEGVKIDKDVNNKLDTSVARDLLRTRSESVNTELVKLLESIPEKRFSLDSIAKKSKEELAKNEYLTALEIKDRARDIDEMISAEKERYGGDLLSGTEINNIKKALWSLGYNQMKPTAHKTARLIGHEIKNVIESGYADKEVRALNKVLGKIAESQDILKNAHGRVIKGGALGRSLAGVTGTIIGSTTGIPLIGPILGKVGAEKLQQYLTSPARLTSKAQKKLQKAKASDLPPSLLQKLFSGEVEIKIGMTIKEVLVGSIRGMSKRDAIKSLTKNKDVLNRELTKMTEGGVPITDKGYRRIKTAIIEIEKMLKTLNELSSNKTPKAPRVDAPASKAPKTPLKSDPLIEEARKYKTAEEFVKAQGQPLFRGGEKLDVARINEEGLPLTLDNKVAEYFARIKNQFDASPAGRILGKKTGQNIVETYFISSQAKIATRADVPDNVFKAYKEANPLTKPNIAEPIINKWARENGFDAIDFRTLGKTSAKEAEIKILNPDILITKSQLIDIWNKAQGGADDLMTQARKYKSAEEFLKAQGTTVYHGGTKIDEVGNMRSKWGAFYMSENPIYAKSYGGKNSVLSEIVIKTEAKLADLRNPSSDLVSKIEEIILPKKTGKTLKIQKPDGSFVEIPETKGGLSNPVHSSSDIIEGIKEGKAYYAEMPEVKQALKKLGYDGMITQESKFGANYGVWNKDVLITKSQLTDIWNKAHKLTSTK